jgi:hypothetical protein
MDSRDSGRWTSPRRVICLTVWLVAWLLHAAPSSAQEAEPEGPGALERAGVSGSVRFGYWSSTRNLDSEEHLGAGMVWLKSARPISERVSFLVEGWAGLRGPFDDADSTGELREAFVEMRFGRLDLRAGRQIFAWGRADGINPSDNLTGKDFTLLAPEDEDGRLGTAALRASYYLGDIAVKGVWLPEFRGHRFPLPAPQGLSFTSDAPEWPGDQWAVRVEQTGGAVDWSVSHFRGRDLFPDLGLPPAGESPAGVASIRLSNHRVRIVAADMAANVGRFGLRAEGAYVGTEDSTGQDPYIKNPFLYLVAGADRTFREHLNLNVQYLYRFVIDYQPLTAGPTMVSTVVAAQQAVLNSQVRQVQHGASFRVAYKWLRDTLEAECAAAATFGPRGHTLRPKIVYAVSDHWKALAGAELFRGESSSVFGLLRPNSVAYLEARWSF